MGSDKAAKAFSEYISPKLGTGMPGLVAVVEGLLAAEPSLGNGRQAGSNGWAAAMDQRFPMLLLNDDDDDDPQTYDCARDAELPWYQRPAWTSGDAVETAEAVRNLNKGFQEMGRQIKDRM